MVRFFQADLNKQLREADGIKPPNNENLNHPHCCAETWEILGNFKSKVLIHIHTKELFQMRTSEDLCHELLLSPLICSIKNSHEVLKAPKLNVFFKAS